jgi:hypothetical protein
MQWELPCTVPRQSTIILEILVCKKSREMRVVPFEPIPLAREIFFPNNVHNAQRELDAEISVVEYRKQNNIVTAQKPVSVAGSSSSYRLTLPILAGLALRYCLGSITSLSWGSYGPTSEYNGSNTGNLGAYHNLSAHHPVTWQLDLTTSILSVSQAAFGMPITR